MPSAPGLRHPASASCLGRHSRLAGCCPNNSSLFPPLAAVVVVAGHIQRNPYYGRSRKGKPAAYNFLSVKKRLRNARRRFATSNIKMKFLERWPERSGGHFKSSGAAFLHDKNQLCPSCNPAGFMVQYLSIHKDVSDSACCVVRHTDAGPVRWARCEPGQVGNQAALSSAFVRFSKPASVCRVTQGGDKTPSSAVLLFLPQRPGKGRDRCVSCTLPQMETPAV